jgi:hypothetical protein
MKTLIASLLITGIAFADAVTDWNAHMRTAVQTQGAQHQARYAAITHLAMYEAVNSITKRYQPYLGYVPASPGASTDAAAVAAAHGVLRHYFPASAMTLDAARELSLAKIADGPAKLAGLSVGEAAAAALVAHRANDGAFATVPYAPTAGVGYWQPTPPGFGAAVGANWGKVMPFAMERGDQFRPEPPPPLTSNTYARDYREVKSVGGMVSAERPQDRTDLARYMAQTSPTQLFNDVAVQLSRAQGLTLSENARAFALMNMAVADASIALFEAKYFYNYWRPITAIRNGDLDGNPRTEPDSAFLSLVNAPAYPSYPSGFGALCNAARSVLEHVFGKGRHSIALPGIGLEYKNLRHLTDDVADARVYGGIHFRFEQDAAEVLGEQVAHYVMKKQLRGEAGGAE